MINHQKNIYCFFNKKNLLCIQFSHKYIIDSKKFVITSKNNPLIKRFRSFKDNLSAKEKGYFCIEGTHLIEEFLKLRINPSKIIATEEWLINNNYLINHLDLKFSV